MKRFSKNLAVFVFMAVLSIMIVTNISWAHLLTTKSIISQEDPNEPQPEMVPFILLPDTVQEDPNDIEPQPEMVPLSLWLGAINEDPNEPQPEMVL